MSQPYLPLVRMCRQRDQCSQQYECTTSQERRSWTSDREGASRGQRAYDSCQRCHSLGETQCFASCLGWTCKREECRYHRRYGSITYAYDAQYDQQLWQVRTPREECKPSS